MRVGGFPPPRLEYLRLRRPPRAPRARFPPRVRLPPRMRLPPPTPHILPQQPGLKVLIPVPPRRDFLPRRDFPPRIRFGTRLRRQAPPLVFLVLLLILAIIYIHEKLFDINMSEHMSATANLIQH